MVSEGDGCGGGGGGGGVGRKRTLAELRQVPWQSWKEWRAVQSALFSGRPSRVQAALDRIAAWHSRGDLPVAVEISGEIISIHQRDPRIRAELPVEVALPEEMLRMMYAMAIMRLVNGVVDQSQKRNTTSVATRAEAVGLPRLLVDIRHESAHNELPAISLLRLGSKEALSWLELHYWKFQERKLLDAQTQLKSSLMDYIVLLHRNSSGSNSQDPSNDDEVEVVVDRRQLKKARKALKQQQNMQFDHLLELSTSACSDLVSIILAEGCLEKQFVPGQEPPNEPASMSSEQSGECGLQDPACDSSCGDVLDDQAARVCKYIIKRLAGHMPELPLMLLTAIIDRLCESRPPEEPLLERKAGKKVNLHASVLQKVTSNSCIFGRLINWSAWLLGEGEGEEREVSRVKSWKLRAGEGPTGCARVGALTDQLLRELLLKCLRSIAANKPLWKPVTLLARRIGNKCLFQQAVLLAKLGTLDSLSVRSKVLSGDDKSGEVNTRHCSEYFDQVGNGHVSGTPEPISGAGEVLCLGTSNVLSHEVVATPLTSQLSLADAKEQQMAFIRDHMHRRAPRARIQDDASTKWRLMSDWTPCPIGLLPPGRYIGFEDLDDNGDDKLDEAAGAKRVVEPAARMGPPPCDVAAPLTPGYENIQEAGATALLSTPKSSDVIRDVEDVFSGKQEVWQVESAQREERLSFIQELRPLKGCLLQNGSFQPCGDELLVILQASIHVL